MPIPTHAQKKSIKLEEAKRALRQSAKEIGINSEEELYQAMTKWRREEVTKKLMSNKQR